MSYRESLGVAWLICWRASMMILFFSAMLAVLLQQPLTLPGSLRGWLWSSAAELLIFYVWIVEAALGKSYSGFSLRLDRSVLKNV